MKIIKQLILSSKDNIDYDQIDEKYIRKPLLRAKNSTFLSFTFNTNSTILFVGCVRRLKFGFNTILKLIQSLRMPKIFKWILFVKKSNLLILEDQNGNIMIYNLDQNNQWKVHQKFKNHTKPITCILMNQKEDLLITGSYDQKIIIQKIHDLSLICQQTIQTNHKVYILSLNSAETILVSCGFYDLIIMVFEFQNNSGWTITQSIEFNEIFNNIYFVSENKFIRLKQSEIQMYEQKEKQLTLIQQQSFKGCSNCKNVSSYLIKQKNILIIRCNCFIYYFKREQNLEYALQYKFKSNYSTHFAIHTDNGKFVASWNTYENENFLNDHYWNEGFQIDFIKNKHWL